MRALYLFLMDLAAPDRRRADAWAGRSSGDAGLVPIQRGSFARWMAAQDATAGARPVPADRTAPARAGFAGPATD